MDDRDRRSGLRTEPGAAGCGRECVVGGRREDGGERPEARECKSQDTGILAVQRKRQSTETCLYRRLKKIVSRTASEKKLAIADSKQLYKPGHGFRQLERGVFVGVARVSQARHERQRGRSPVSWQDLIHRHAPQLPCYADYDCDLPIDATQEEVEGLANRFRSTCGFAGVRLVDLRVRLVYPREFNELTAHFGTKGAAFSHVSVGLLREMMDNIAENSPHLREGLACRIRDSPYTCRTQVVCDKHGGRNRYAALLQHHFPEQWIDTLAESWAG